MKGVLWGSCRQGQVRQCGTAGSQIKIGTCEDRKSNLFTPARNSVSPDSEPGPVVGGQVIFPDRNLFHGMRIHILTRVPFGLDGVHRSGESKSSCQRNSWSSNLGLQYMATWFRYEQGQNIAILAGKHPSRWVLRGDPKIPPFFEPDYPYRIDPFRSFTLTATMSQPFFTGGRLSNDYKFAQLGAGQLSI